MLNNSLSNRPNNSKNLGIDIIIFTVIGYIHFVFCFISVYAVFSYYSESNPLLYWFIYCLFLAIVGLIIRMVIYVFQKHQAPRTFIFRVLLFLIGISSIMIGFFMITRLFWNL